MDQPWCVCIVCTEWYGVPKGSNVCFSTPARKVRAWAWKVRDRALNFVLEHELFLLKQKNKLSIPLLRHRMRPCLFRITLASLGFPSVSTVYHGDPSVMLHLVFCPPLLYNSRYPNKNNRYWTRDNRIVMDLWKPEKINMRAFRIILICYLIGILIKCGSQKSNRRVKTAVSVSLRLLIDRNERWNPVNAP